MDEQPIIDLAGRQHGLVSMAQALRLGATKSSVANAVRTGRMTRTARGVLAVGPVRGDFHSRVMTAVLTAYPAAASHSSAAWLWGWNVRHSRPEVTISDSRRVDRRGVRVHHSAMTQPEHFGRKAGIPVTTPARTLLDLSGRIPEDELATAFDAGLEKRNVSLDQVAEMLDGLPTGAGRRPLQLARLLAMRREGQQGASNLEARVIRLLNDTDLPLPVCQYKISVGVNDYQLDLAWPDLRRFAEPDGFEHHGQRRSFDEDRRRQNHLVMRGWVGVRITTAFTDAEILTTVRALLALPRG